MVSALDPFKGRRQGDKLMGMAGCFAPLFFAFLLTSCTAVKKTAVNYRLKEARDKKSGQVAYSPPAPPFKPRQSDHSDAFWWNGETKNTISYFSSCPKGGPRISLKEMEAGALSELENYEITESTQKGNTRQTRIQTKEKGKVTFLTRLHIIKTPRCFYILNFVSGSPENFRKDEPVFNRFISGFKGL